MHTLHFLQGYYQVSGHLVQIEDFMCNLPNNHFEHGATSGNMFAVVRRGVCKFSTKVETAVKAGFEGVVILDDQNNTDVKRISGVKTSLTENVPVVFLLRKEAAILKRLLAESQNITATIQGEFFYINIWKKGKVFLFLTKIYLFSQL